MIIAVINRMLMTIGVSEDYKPEPVGRFLPATVDFELASWDRSGDDLSMGPDKQHRVSSESEFVVGIAI